MTRLPLHSVGRVRAILDANKAFRKHVSMTDEAVSDRAWEVVSAWAATRKTPITLADRAKLMLTYRREYAQRLDVLRARQVRDPIMRRMALYRALQGAQ